MKHFAALFLVACMILALALLVDGCAQRGTVSVKSGALKAGTVRWAAFSCGPLDTVALKTDGTLWAWGRNRDGELGLGDTRNRNVPTQVGSANDWATAVACGDTTLAVKRNGTLWAWGSNMDGQLGRGAFDEAAHATPTKVGKASTWAAVSCGWSYIVALRKNGTLWAWGENQWGQLGLGTLDDATHATPTQVGSASSWAAVSCGGFHTLALRRDGTLWAWGQNRYGELGLVGANYRVTPTEIGNANDWAAVSCGLGHTIALKKGGTLWAWGYNLNGQLGLGTFDEADHATPTQVGDTSGWAAVSCGTFDVHALKNDGTLWAWGSNMDGELGRGTVDKAAHPVPAEVGSASP